MADTTGLDLDANLPWTGLRNLPLLELKRTIRLSNDHCPHDSYSCTPLRPEATAATLHLSRYVFKTHFVP